MKKNDDNAIIGRIRHLRIQQAGQRGKSQFARDLGISASTYSYYEKDRVPPIEILLKICEVTGAQLQWLLTGSSTEENLISGANAALLRKIDSLLNEKPNLSPAIRAFVELLCERKALEKDFFTTEPSLSPRPGWIPVLGRTAAGMVHFWENEVLPQSSQVVTELDDLVKKHIGKEIISSAGGMLSIDLHARALLDGIKGDRANLIQITGDTADQIVEFVQCEEVFKLFPDSFALQIDGDSMSPRINDGDVVVLSPSVPAAQGQVAIARLVGQIGVTCKLIRTTGDKVHLIPINERYQPKIVPKDDLLWALAVLCHIST